MAKQLQIPNVPATHGRFIYAYCNVRTNQVLYSLERALKPSHLKQLADVGANNNPPKLRKDIWRPLWTVTLPDSHNARQQGLDLFRKLREYRMLHETNWELPEEIKRPYTEKEIEAMQKKLDDRGGSKNETVYDIIKREKWKMRVKMVMDQKANSIADLAAILLRQAEQAATVAKARAAVKPQRTKEVDLMVYLAKQHAKGQLTRLADRKTQLENALRENQDKLRSNEYKTEEREAFSQTSLRQQKMIDDIQLQTLKMKWCAQAVSNAQYWDKVQADIQLLTANIEAMQDDILEAERRSENTRLPPQECQAASEAALRMKRVISNSEFFIEKMNWVGLVPGDAQSRAKLVASLTQSTVNDWAKLAANAGKIIRKGKQDLTTLFRQRTLTKTSENEEDSIESQVEATRRRIAKAKFALRTAADNDNNFVHVAIEAQLAGIHAGQPGLSESVKEQKTADADVAELRSRPTAKLVANAVTNLKEVQGEHAAEKAPVEQGTPKEGLIRYHRKFMPECEYRQYLREREYRQVLRKRDFRQFLPELPAPMLFIQAAKRNLPVPSSIPKRAKQALDRKLKITAPILAFNSVTVRWSNILDAEFAEVWPEDVKHEPLGFVKYIAPKPDAKPRVGTSHLEPEDGETDNTTTPVSSADGLIESGATAEDRNTDIDRIQHLLLKRTSLKADATKGWRAELVKQWAVQDATMLKNAQADRTLNVL